VSQHVPQVTVVLTAHNPGDFLSRSLGSVLAQTFEDFECIVVDDGSDVPVATLMPDTDPRVRVLRLDQNRGVAVARNLGVSAARGDLVAFLDDDDSWKPEKLALQVAAFAQSPGAWFGYTGFDWHFPDGRVLAAPAVPMGYRDLLASGSIHHSSTMMRKSAYEAVGGSNPTLVLAQDNDLHLRLLLGPAPVVVPDCVSDYHLHGENRSGHYRRSIAFRKLVISMHAERARALGDTETLRVCELAGRRADEEYARQAFDAARQARRDGDRVAMAQELLRSYTTKARVRAASLASSLRKG
jgi:glycosyltransferase involved in cell wall biosynthesis